MTPGRVTPNSCAIAHRYAALTAGVTVLILYGSLFPFHFFAGGFSPGALLRTSGIPSDRGDFLANILLYIPLGFFGFRAAGRTGWGVWNAFILGAALSFAIETVQFCDYGRVPSMADVYANALGTLLGAMAAAFLPGNLSFAGLLLSCWLGSRLLPYLPSLHLHKYWTAVTPLLTSPRVEPLEVFRYFSLWLAAAAVLEAITAKSRWILPALMVCVLAARIVIVDVVLQPSEIAGAILASIVWIALLSRPSLRAAAVASVFMVFVILQALEPFHFLSHPRAFGWIPFQSFMQGPRENGSRIFLEKSFTYGALVWLLARARVPFSVATVCAAALVFSLRLTQIYLPGRSAEITDALMLLMLAATMKMMEPA